MQTIKLSFRRHFLDTFLLNQNFKGDVIDVGGKKDNTRGAFTPPLDKVNSWKFCNIDPVVAPDFLCSAEEIPVDDESFDMAVCCEVIEHLENPERVLNEISRILKKDGTLIGSIPFMYPRHADPYDFQRWTSKKLETELAKAGFGEIKISAMGGTLSVVWDMVRIEFEAPTLINKVARALLRVASIFILKHYDRNSGSDRDNTSGYVFTAIKKS